MRSTAIESSASRLPHRYANDNPGYANGNKKGVVQNIANAKYLGVSSKKVLMDRLLLVGGAIKAIKETMMIDTNETLSYVATAPPSLHSVFLRHRLDA